MQIPCPYNAPCIDDASSFGNFSSEDPDQLLFHSIHYKNQDWDGDFNIWNACLGYCTSTVSQEEADRCADNNAAICERATQYYNTSQTCTHTCADGSTQTYTVPAEHFAADSQAQADALAYNFACSMVYYLCGETPPGSPPMVSPPQLPVTTPGVRSGNQRQTCTKTCSAGSVFTFVVPDNYYYGSSVTAANVKALNRACSMANTYYACFTQMWTSFCSNEAVNEYVALTGSFQSPVTWTLVGSLPPGLSFSYVNHIGFLVGTPTGGGYYPITLTATQANGSYTTQTFYIYVMEFTTASPLPDGETGTAYSQYIEVDPTSYVGDLYLSLAAGDSMPLGLMFDTSTGLISGTPTVDGDNSFTILAMDSTGTLCEKEFTLHIEAAGADWVVSSDYTADVNFVGDSTSASWDHDGEYWPNPVPPPPDLWYRGMTASLTIGPYATDKIITVAGNVDCIANGKSYGWPIEFYGSIDISISMAGLVGYSGDYLVSETTLTTKTVAEPFALSGTLPAGATTDLIVFTQVVNHFNDGQCIGNLTITYT